MPNEEITNVKILSSFKNNLNRLKTASFSDKNLLMAYLVEFLRVLLLKHSTVFDICTAENKCIQSKYSIFKKLTEIKSNTVLKKCVELSKLYIDNFGNVEFRYIVKKLKLKVEELISMDRTIPCFFLRDYLDMIMTH
ncbi:hypothetical protein NGRA_1560 [Nosema granulosis]|uniref:Uncharacterized protein n=1 Tax=Nosema granulosis TaxID=83296 RepID=A0A9P6KZG6_9MICR|nr:hypothetical protein NGRA_1560 [Nosema granulosis]